MNKFYKIVSILGLVLLLWVALLLTALVGSNSAVFGGLVERQNVAFVNGLRAGASAIQVINSSGELVGPIDQPSTGSSTYAGTSTFIGPLVVDGFLSGVVTLTVASASSTPTAAQICD